MKKLLPAALLGGLIAFVWLSISWMALPWHRAARFTDDTEVAAVLQRNAPSHGVYLVPNKPEPSPWAMAAFQRRAAAGPFAFAIVRPGAGEISMPRNMALGFLNQCAAAFLIASLLLCTRPLAYGARVFFVVQIAVAGGLLCHVPSAIWWEMPFPWLLAEMADLAIAWTLAGLVIARFANPAAAPSPGVAQNT